MSDFAEWFFEDTGDKLVRRRLEGKLQAASTTQAREARDLRSRMSQIQGTLEQRLDRLAKAFDAFVELSDVRAELAVFEEQTTIRHAAHRLLRTLVRHVTDPSALAGDIPALPDSMPRCPGYWLRPAVVSLSAAASGDTTGAIAALAEARDLDQARTATFLAVGLGLAGRPAEALPLLSAALGTPAEQTTYAQRALWRACAHGVYGDQGEQAARAWLTGYVRGLDAGSADKERAKWDSDADYAFGTVNLATQARRGLPDSLSGEDALTGPLVAGGKLSALSSWVREAVTGEPARSGAGAPDGPAPDDAVDPVTAGLAATVAALAEEGSEEEIELRRRARELREVIDDRKTAVRPTWDTAEGETLALLRKDAFGDGLRLRRIALASCADWVTGLASRLAADAGTPPPDQVTITSHGHAITVEASGQASLREAYAEIEERNGPQNMSDKLFHRKDLEEDAARQEKGVAADADEAGRALRERVAEIRAAADRARADRDWIAGALARVS